MAEQDTKIVNLELSDFKLKPISSSEKIAEASVVDDNDDDILSIDDALIGASKIAADAVLTDDKKLHLSDSENAFETAATETGNSIFKELSAPKLPELPKENRARLQMQSPNRIYFYWSFKENPFQILSRVFGNRTNYQLVAKLLNQTNDREELYPIETDGSAWFEVDADSSYLVEIGFYAVNRPFVRVLFSNTLQTPRSNPSSRQDYSEYFAVSADQFAKVLDVSGFQQDAFEVALAGDDIEAADTATETAFSQIFALTDSVFDASKSSEMRFVLLALASGYSLEELRGQISPSLFAFLQTNAEKLSAEAASAALQENFGVSTDETYEEEIFGETVFGASLVNFPRPLKRRTLPTKYQRRSKFTSLSSLR